MRMMNELNENGTSSISSFYDQQSILITGATGFVGKVLVEKLLRSCQSVKTIYVLIRKKDALSPKQILQNIFMSKLFIGLRQNDAKKLYKVVPVHGDIRFANLGLSPDDEAAICNQVSVVFHSAATINFTHPLKETIRTNLLGTKHVIDLCHKIKQLKALVYVSTAFSNYDKNDTVDDIVYKTPVSAKFLLETVLAMDDAAISKMAPALLGKYPNAYSFVKAVAENLVAEEFARLPVAIVRPSIITASWKDPFPGWIDNCSAATGICIAVATGLLRRVPLPEKTFCDIIPVDVVASMMISAAWYTANFRPQNGGIPVYNCTSREAFRVTFREVVALAVRYSTKHPSANLLRHPSCTAHDNWIMYSLQCAVHHQLIGYVADGISFMGGHKMRMARKFAQVHQFIDLLRPFTMKDWIFSQRSVLRLMHAMTLHDKELFQLDLTKLCLNEYFENYMLGIRKHLLKEDPVTIPSARRSLQRLQTKTRLLGVAATFVGVATVLWYANSLFSCYQHLLWM